MHGTFNKRESHGIMQCMDDTGHHTVSWNPDDADDVANAKTAFDEQIAAGFRAFRADEKGRQGAQIREFDPTAAKIVMVPRIAGG